MRSIPGRGPRRVRALFVSDIHLGCKHSQAKEFLKFLSDYQPQQLYVVGDFIDGWKLKRRWQWPAEYDGIFKQILAMHRAGTQLYYTPGNHDSFLRGFLTHLGALKLVQVKDQFIHVTADRRRLLVTHGDKFDYVEMNCPWLCYAASHAYDVLLTANRWLSRLRGESHSPYAFCAAVKQRVKTLVRHISDFEHQLVEAARSHRCHGIVCGHIHVPRIRDLDDVVYYNTGDWVENCSALVEYEDGDWELVRKDGHVIDRRAACPDLLSEGTRHPAHARSVSSAIEPAGRDVLVA